MGFSKYKLKRTDFENVEHLMPIRQCSTSKTLNKTTATLSVDSMNVLTDTTLQDMQLYNSETARILFKGKAMDQSISSNSFGVDYTSLKALDILSIANNRLVAEAYPEEDDPYSLRAILIDLLDKYFPEVGQSKIQNFDSSIDELVFDYEPLFKSLKRIAKSANCYFFVDEDLDLHFFQGNEGTIGRSYTRADILYSKGVELDYSSTEVVNKLWVIGAKQASSQIKEQTFNYDGVNRIFNLGYEPNYVSMFDWNGSAFVPVPSKQEKNDDGAQFFLYNKLEKNISIPDYRAIPSSGIFKIEYKPTVEIIDFYEDLESRAKYGLYEKAIKSKDIKTKSEARKIARNSLQTNSSSIKDISFSTKVYEPLELGKLMPLKLDRYGIDGLFLILQIQTIYNKDDAIPYAKVTVRG